MTDIRFNAAGALMTEETSRPKWFSPSIDRLRIGDIGRF